MTSKPSVAEVRARVRTRETWELLLLAAATQNVDVAGAPPRGAVRRFEAMRAEVAAELERRGIIVAPNPDLMAVASYAGDADAAKNGGWHA